ncbi:ABC transporter substrate-binding protein [Frankia sp. CNm7]|uniref:ABC transporter substrate-binding protein n=1 Tax=Frankia nepalensis TaxID=1836974 RepID=A0A937RJV7_9ACTN|nr:ABC transporter substrate-binding protein [Frankia nepalensis]MBL7496165.1 ABC transporter substrate-binding protein [Frankia nepalensis]MBL7508897.1 ABC transporter substrate-binding protein [Frankia nepalensis]MBL7516737.1 ABC transporter substrate-binding protein [Frankia nepalensis]MBL7628674.1 ABC transporter substrate-binding protein [Frankia nepalensis]
MRSRRRLSLLLLPALSASILLTACGGGDTTGDEFTPASAAPIKAVAGCENGWTDPADRSATRAPARCAANAPAPEPLATKTKLVITAATPKAEFIAPIRWALANGEFEKENLEVELRQVPAADGLSLLAQGETDIMVGSPDAAFFNAVNQGFGLRWVMGNFSAPATSKTGIWARDVDGRPATFADLKGKTIASVLGNGSPTVYPIVQQAEKAGLTFDDLKFQTLPAADVVTALVNGGVDGAWVLDPLWIQLVDKPGLTYLGGQPAGEPLGGVLFGQNILGEKRAAGVAFTRAVVRAINTEFAADYKSDPAFVEELAKVVELPAAQLTQTPSLVTDWEIRSGTSTRLQDAMIKSGALKYDAPMDESKVVDRSFYEAAVGHKD